MYIGLNVKSPLFLSDFNETWIFGSAIRKSSNIKFLDNPSSGRQVAPCGRTDKTKLIVALRNFANAPKTQQPVCQHNIYVELTNYLLLYWY